ncbi:MAG: site-2 protease family protein [Clostridia bacterium]|nr:site-2 protease family protein [Clostridia bacterium]
MNFLERLFGIDLKTFLLSLPIILIALVVHEVSHGYIAMKLGDPTARNLGRLTLNPLKHLDPIGTVCMVLFHFGWAKPVPVNTRYFKKPKRDMALTALAGPVSNFILGFFGVLVYRILYAIFMKVAGPATSDLAINVMSTTLQFFYMFGVLNVSLGVFNLIPIPPLDGSRILLVFLPTKAYFAVMKYERYIMIGFFVLLFVGRRVGFIFSPISTLVGWVIDGMGWLIGLIPGL